MTFTLSFLISAKSDAAKAELEAVSRATAKTKGDIASLGSAAATTDVEITRLRKELGELRAQFQAAAGAEAAAMTQMQAMAGQITRLETAIGRGGRSGATGATKELVALFDEMAGKMGGGQNPLLIAAESGGAMTRALGAAGARTAVAGLAASFLELLNPVGLVTLAATAAGAALAQWLFSSEADTTTLAEAMSQLSRSTNDYRTAAERAQTPMVALRREFGDQAEAVRNLYQAQAELAKLQATLDLAAAGSKVKQTYAPMQDILAGLPMKGDEVMMSAGRGLVVIQGRLERLKAEFGMTAVQARELDSGLNRLGEAKGPTEVAQAYAQIRTALMAVRDEAGMIPPKIAEAAVQATIAEEAAQKLAAPLATAEGHARGLASIDMQSAIAAAAGSAMALAKNLGISLDMAEQIAKKSATAKEATTLRFGLGPVAPGQMGLGGFVGTDSGLSYGKNPGRGWSQSGVLIVADPANDGAKPSGSGRRGGAGGGATRSEANAVADLLAKEQRQLAVMRETDPVQREMLRNREALAGATAKERKEVEAAITARLKEQDHMKALTDAWSFMKNAAGDALEGIIDGSKTAGEAIQELIKSLAMAVIKANLLGEGPLAGIFGTSESGGLIGMMLSGLTGITPKAEGGLIVGPGGPKDDAVLARLSAGEFVVNAAATALYRPLLEALNGADHATARRHLRGFAAGGFVGAPTPPPMIRLATVNGAAAQSAGRTGEPLRVAIDLKLSDDLNARIESRAEDAAIRVTNAGLSEFSRKVLPTRVGQINRDRRAAG